MVVETQAAEMAASGLMSSILANGGNVLAAIGAFLAVAISGLGSAKGMGIAASAASGVTAENEKYFSKVLALQALPQTQVIYGFVIGLIILWGINSGELTIEQGWICIPAGLTVGIAGLSATHQGKVAAAGIGGVARNPGILAKALILGVMPEFVAILGFVTALFMLVFSGIL
ncbi:MAG: V-type ATP synthase subunit K [Candidatus Altiarchaeota archaeon]